MAKKTQSSLSTASQQALLQVLEQRFAQYPARHKGIDWKTVSGRLQADPAKCRILQQMEETGGEPDVVGRDSQTGAILFVDCAAESPSGRRSLCYDREGLESRKENRPANSAIDMADAMGVQLLTEQEYLELQKLGAFDLKTSSWLLTPDALRAEGGAIFGDRRFGRVFIYHNGAQSYYAARGFRAKLLV